MEENEEPIEELNLDVRLSDNDKKIILPDDLNQVYVKQFSEQVFETPFTKSYVSLFLNGVNKNIHATNLFKFCVLLGCSPNDLFDYENWEYKTSQVINKGKKVTNEQIKDFL